jgi:crotonobetainyl-CoA:carnitine CoA-transferase CaiB-like acyl-CoA transferase
MLSAHAIAAALRAREVKGGRRHIDIGLMDCRVSLLVNVAQYYLLDGRGPGPMGSQHASMVPCQAFGTADTYIVIAVNAEKYCDGFYRVLGLEDLIKYSRFYDNLSRSRNREKLIPILQERRTTKSAEEWLALSSEAQVPCGSINTLVQVFSHPQAIARNMVVDIDHEKAGRLRCKGNPVKTVGLEEGPFDPAPLLGEHTDQVLRSVLGYPTDRIASLRAEGAIA